MPLFVGQAVGCTVHVDAGVDYGQTSQLGEGGAKDSTPGNLFVQVSVAPDSVLTRHGTNIHSDMDVTFADVILDVFLVRRR